MRRLLLVSAVLLTGCQALSTNLVLSAASSLPGAYLPPAARCIDCEVEKNEADALADRVPAFMEQSRQQASPGAAVTRTGYFSWQLSSSLVTASCNVRGTRWRCDRPLTGEFSQQL